MLRLSSVAEPSVTQLSAVFTVSPPITSYYVNIAGDADLTDNEYTTAAGDDANNGLSPASPMASIRNLLAVYDLQPGDTIYVDTGLYTTAGNILITQEDSGVRLQGPTQPGHSATINRDSNASNAFVVELDNADDITLANLQLTGAHTGVLLRNGSERAIVRDSVIYENDVNGLFIEDAASKGGLIENNVFYGDGADIFRDQFNALFTNAGAITIRSNVAYTTNRRGGNGFRVLVGTEDLVLLENNLAYLHSGTSYAITARNFEVIGNTARDTNAGFILRDASDSRFPDPHISRSSGNVAFNIAGIGFDLGTSNGEHTANEAHHAATAFRVDLTNGGFVADSTAWSSEVGFDLNEGSLIGSRVFDTTTGVLVDLRSVPEIVGNTIYSNRVGISIQAGPAVGARCELRTT